MAMKRGFLRILVAAAVIAAARMAAAQTVTVGAASTISDAPIYIAERKGFFRAEGIDVKVVNTSTLNTLLKSVGLAYSDVQTVDLPFPDHVIALKNRSVEASASVEPGPAIAVRDGDAVVIRSDDEILPNHQIAVLLYAEDFARKHRDEATRFMRAYIRAVRFYNGALQNGRLAGANADEVIAILSAATPIKSRAIYAAITPPGIDPDGHVNADSLAYDLAFYREQGLIKGAINLGDVLDASFALSVAKELGPYRK
jgi:NitT/TauT family transport system substrate-binding protein